MDSVPTGRPLLADMLREMDEARNASPHAPQQPSEMVRERNERLAVKPRKFRRCGWRGRLSQQLNNRKVNGCPASES